MAPRRPTDPTPLPAVINLILKRGYDGAITEGSFGISPGYGHDLYRGAFLYGTTWNGGDVTISYEHYNQDHTEGTARDYYTFNFFDAQGVDNRTTLINSLPGTITIGNAKGLTASGYTAVTLPGVPGGFTTKNAPDCTNCYAIPKGQNRSGADLGADRRQRTGGVERDHAGHRQRNQSVHLRMGIARPGTERGDDHVRPERDAERAVLCRRVL